MVELFDRHRASVRDLSTARPYTTPSTGANRITGAGVTSGIDFALYCVAEVFGAAEARRIQLALEYDPAPPFESGSPASANPALVAEARKRMAAFLAERRAATERAAERLG